MFRSTSLRLAALYTTAFALAVVVLGVITLFSTRAALTDQFDARIAAEAAALAQEYRTEGLNGVVQAVRERDRTPGALDYGLKAPDGAAMVGRLAVNAAPIGWSTVEVRPRGDGHESIRVLTVALPQGYHLMVGDDEERVEALDGAVLRGFGWAFLGVVLLGVVGGYALSGDVHRRLAAISGTAEAIIDGDLARRVPVRGSDDDLDRLALTFNRMLDRIAALMESLNQVSNDIAHDMRTPLTRLRQKLEAGLAAPAESQQALEAGLADLDSILETFAALLRIAQIEGGARRAGFRPCDLSEVARTVVDAFAPSAEEGRQTLSLVAAGSLMVEGDRELLTQMLVNLVENALRHAGVGARITVWAVGDDAGRRLEVSDDGPGVPEIARERLFDRFYRLENSRSTPGNGLGLALVAAIAKLHGADIELADAGPGLRVRVKFPRPG
ncbi:MAG: HAMP domain-containing sensor histidine kinase [Phenylobacterium sp.]|uniref:HAMP domain-containing sensor histidine kinase n=1 Tax=Phenylobacterium sp. TaxID=1871053 RepID=UPI0027191FD2|nr:HAMP domain-containing sensor histidine kinase [Phenylobacterium sp.]MDO8912156.1 HAMP domain-containing sensor histidine kinase [Phenylobacterium sp.]MDO9247052.1 HAMP domain-containing sensor histidine kinase [Phenylobacterium sp.]